MFPSVVADIDFDARPIWNPEYTLTFSENSHAAIGLPMNKGVVDIYKHFKPLSLYSTIWNAPSINVWNILSYFDGTNSIRDIISSIQQQYPEIDVDVTIEKIKQLLLYGFIVYS